MSTVIALRHPEEEEGEIRILLPLEATRAGRALAALGELGFYILRVPPEEAGA